MRSITRNPPSPASTDLTLGSHSGAAGPSTAGPSNARPRPAPAIPDGLAHRPPPRPIPEHDKQLAGYLMGRAVDGRAIEGDDLTSLRQANDLLQQTREALPIGRGNVTTDIAATNGHSYRTYAAARVVRNSRKLNEFALHRAAIAEIAGAGNCGEHAAVAVHKLAAHMSEGQQAHSVVNRARDHGWAELRTPTPDERPTIVVDAWGEGPAIHAEDGLFSSTAIPAEHRATDYSYDAGTAPAALQCKAAFLADPVAAEIGTRIAAVRTGLAALNRTQRKTFGPTPIIDTAFANRVAEKMAHVDDMALFRQNLPALESTALRNELLATSVLRQLGASVRDATAAAPEVSEAAGALARTPQNPPRARADQQQAHAAAIDQSVRQTLLALFPSSPSDADVPASTSGGMRDREPDADHDGRNVRQRI